MFGGNENYEAESNLANSFDNWRLDNPDDINHEQSNIDMDMTMDQFSQMTNCNIGPSPDWPLTTSILGGVVFDSDILISPCSYLPHSRAPFSSQLS